MKNLISTLLSAFLVLSNLFVFAQGNPEPIAKEIIKAYQKQDLNKLKVHATAMVQNGLVDGYFKTNDAKLLVAMAKDWDGTINEIRYQRISIMGTSPLLAFAHFGDLPGGKVKVATLTSLKESPWKAFTFGITDMDKEEFLSLSKEIPTEKESKPKPAAKGPDTPIKGFSVEMASGETYSNPSLNRLKASLKTLDDDNFFLILNSSKGFLQTTISEQGYIVQHNHGDGMFEAKSYFTFEMLVDIFEKYLNNDDWKDVDSWVGM
jgi:hypothetical protein